MIWYDKLKKMDETPPQKKKEHQRTRDRRKFTRHE